MNKRQRIVLYVISVAALAACFFVKPIRQDVAYHHFADTLTLFSLPNFWNVVSNLPFAVIGIMGLKLMLSIRDFPLKQSYSWFFTGILLTGFGSAFYHFNPNNNTLIWDRLPMTLTFMSFLSAIVGNFIDEKAGRKLLYPFIAAGILSIVYWIATDDLRLYALIQFLPIVLILIILFLSQKHRHFKKYFSLMIVAYVMAKFLESYDVFVYEHTYKTFSGHSLKHLVAAVAPFLFYKFAARQLDQHAGH